MLKLNPSCWKIWLDYCDEMKCDKPFSLTTEIINNPKVQHFISNYSAIILPANIIPANIQPEIAFQIISDITRQNALTIQLDQIEISFLLGSIESSRFAYAIKQKFSIAYWRNANMALEYNAIPHLGCWQLQDSERRS
jgi:hypothetical protein